MTPPDSLKPLENKRQRPDGTRCRDSRGRITPRRPTDGDRGPQRSLLRFQPRKALVHNQSKRGEDHLLAVIHGCCSRLCLLHSEPSIAQCSNCCGPFQYEQGTQVSNLFTAPAKDMNFHFALFIHFLGLLCGAFSKARRSESFLLE